jgi:hypothetical protein
LHGPAESGAVYVYEPSLFAVLLKLPQLAPQVAGTFDENDRVAPSLTDGAAGEIVKVGGGPTVSLTLDV